MEEAPDDQYVESEKEDVPVESAPTEVPEQRPKPRRAKEILQQEAEDLLAADPDPDAPVCKPVKKNLKEKVQCACGRWMSEHTYRYQHKCKAQSVAEASAPVEQAPPPPKLVRARATKETVVQEKLPPPEKPVKKRAAIKKAQIAEDSHPLDVQAPKEYQPAPMDIYQAMLLNRQEQARMHHERMLAPYAQMFSMRR